MYMCRGAEPALASAARCEPGEPDPIRIQVVNETDMREPQAPFHVLPVHIARTFWVLLVVLLVSVETK